MQCLDTSALIELLKGSEKGIQIKHVLEDSLSTTAFSVHELLVGASEREINIVQDFLKGFEILSYGVGSASRSAEIEKDLTRKGNKINIIDVLIAGICMNSNRMLITTDRDFRKIRGLDVIVIH